MQLVTGITASQQVRTERCQLMEMFVRVSGAAVINVRNKDVNGAIVIPISMAAAGTFSYGSEFGLPFDAGIYFEVVSGGPVVATVAFE